jgi:hypothetical protein
MIGALQSSSRSSEGKLKMGKGKTEIEFRHGLNTDETRNLLTAKHAKYAK